MPMAMSNGLNKNGKRANFAKLMCVGYSISHHVQVSTLYINRGFVSCPVHMGFISACSGIQLIVTVPGAVSQSVFCSVLLLFNCRRNGVAKWYYNVGNKEAICRMDNPIRIALCIYYAMTSLAVRLIDRLKTKCAANDCV